MTFQLADALASLRPGVEYVIRGDVIELYQHADPQPTADELQAELDRLEAAQPMVELRQSAIVVLLKPTIWHCLT